MSEKKKVRFIRKKGRVIPLFSKKEISSRKKKVKTAVGAASAGAITGTSGSLLKIRAGFKHKESVAIAKLAISNRSKPIAQEAVKRALSSMKSFKLGSKLNLVGTGVFLAGTAASTILGLEEMKRKAKRKKKR